MNYFSGNVGIGTTAPGYKLDVQGGQINASGGLCMAGNCKTSWAEVVSGGITGSGTANTIPLWSSGSALTDSIMTQNGLGDNITVAGSITASAFRDSENSNYYINPAGTTSALLAGNVGIGTTAPGYKLDVTGSVNATGGLYWNGNPVARSGDNISIFTNDSGYITDGNTGWNNSYGYITSESDPQVGALTSNKWCTSDGSQVNCTSDTPSAGVTSINSKTGAVNIIAGTGGITVDNTISNTIKISSTFSESDTLDSVTDRGNSTYNPIIVSRMYDYQNTYYEVNPAYISYMNKIQLNDTLNILAPVDTDGNWIWTSTANASNSGDGWVYATQNVSLDSVRPILGIRISGYSDDGGTCVAVVVNYFAGGITNNAEFDDLDLFNGGQITATYDSTGNGNMITRNFIFDQLVSGRDLGGQLYYQDNYAHNKSAGLNYIPPNKTLYLYGTAYGDPGSESINCSVDVLYGNI
ncbi:MAG: hypothetical protein UX06_C0040G0003 [Candidatus Giovannonibacteria bacterium GW2011_GWA2_45_21]|uniref:Uncharacterized protein n=1 Tax=Candidatus Giovannonibacteria bacterium GW2011_GWA2_45_21 TaxID=1618649 RepID=A0A0G1PDS9_9BACT|nr:MAG: hypothetical protein UX06_C0040G0003 [Candidatus Giovannonibacteria bacterium GW2011_GWA2_45_21]